MGSRILQRLLDNFDAAAFDNLRDNIFSRCEKGTLSIVGNANSILKTNNGNLIDNTFVLRMNRGLPIKPNAQGAKTDMLCYSEPSVFKNQEIDNFDGIKVHMSPKGRILGDNCGVYYFPIDFWEELFKTLKSRPSVGVMSIYLIHKPKVPNVHVFGFDFKKTKTFYSSFNKRRTHDFEAEERFCLNLIAQNGWIFH